jgi:hypothetical protein
LQESPQRRRGLFVLMNGLAFRRGIGGAAQILSDNGDPG